MRRLTMFTGVFFCLLFISMQGQAQEPHTSELYKTLQAKDSLLFNVVFNTCDLTPLNYLISEDLEFYHDQGGSTNGKVAFIESIKNGICNLSYKATRQLVPGTLEVYPLKKNGVLYGAVQMGEHRFFATEKDKAPYFTSYAQFTHLWLLDNGEWKLKRVLSYDHQTVDKTRQSAIGSRQSAMVRDGVKGS